MTAPEPAPLPPGDDEPDAMWFCVNCGPISPCSEDCGWSPVAPHPDAGKPVAPVLPPGVTLPDGVRVFGTDPDGLPMVAGDEPPEGWRHVRGRYLWTVEPLPPVPPAEPRTERVPVADALADERKIPSADDGDAWWQAVGIDRAEDGRLRLYATKATDDLIVEHWVTAGDDGKITVLAEAREAVPPTEDGGA